MAQPALETAVAPFTAFRFLVEFWVEGVSDQVCSAAFAEVSGLEMTMEPKTIREGGNNTAQIHLTGRVSYGQLTLKRGMTGNLDLWSWFRRVLEPGQAKLRGEGVVVMLGADGREQVRFVLTRCLPVKLKAPDLNAKDGLLAIEEAQIAFESLRLVPAGA